MVLVLQPTPAISLGKVPLAFDMSILHRPEVLRLRPSTRMRTADADAAGFRFFVFGRTLAFRSSPRFRPNWWTLHLPFRGYSVPEFLVLAEWTLFSQLSYTRAQKKGCEICGQVGG